MHVVEGVSGAIASTVADTMVLENNQQVGFSVLAPDDKNIYVALGSPTAPIGTEIRWNYDEGNLTFGTRKGGANIDIKVSNQRKLLWLDNAGKIGINMQTPDSMIDTLIKDSSTKGLILTGSSGQSADYINVNSPTGTDGDLFKVDSDGQTHVQDRLYLNRTGGTGQYFRTATEYTVQLHRQADNSLAILGVGTLDASIFRNNADLTIDFDANGFNPSSDFKVRQAVYDSGLSQVHLIVKGTTGYVGI